MSVFNVGDYVSIKKSGNIYLFSKYKSTGTVVDIRSSKLLIKFDTLTGSVPVHELDHTYWIEVKHVKRIKQMSTQDRVCMKIRQMEERWKKFQERKSCHV